MHSAAVLIGGVAPDDLTDLSLTLAEGQGATGQLTYTGTMTVSVPTVTLVQRYNGLETRRETFAVTPEFGGATDAHKSRVRRVSLNDLTDRLRTPLDGRGTMGLPDLPERYKPIVYGVDKPLGSDLPTGEECEEKARSASISTVSAVQRALTAANLDLLVLPGPGLVNPSVPDDYSPGADVGAVLNDLLLTNGVPYWLEDDLLIVDGRALPTGPFELPPEDANAAVIEWSEERPEPEREPQLADYLARCAENVQTEPLEGSSFELTDGTLTTTETSGTQGVGGDYSRVVSTVTKEGGRITGEEERGFGYLTRPGGRFIGPTYVRTLQNEYHPLVPSALVRTVETTYVFADYGLLQNELGDTEGNSELLKELWPRFSAQSPYVSKRTVKTQRWNAEGLLRATTETTREFSGLTTLESVIGTTVRLLYKDSSRNEDMLPIGSGLYRYRVSGSTYTDRPVYETGEGEGGEATQEPVGIMSDRTPFSSTSVSDAAPPSVSLPLPKCGDNLDNCLLEAQREYNEAHADWSARVVNNAPRRTYTVQFIGKLRLGLRLGMIYAGCKVADVSHSLSRNSMSTTVTLEHAITP